MYSNTIYGIYSNTSRILVDYTSTGYRAVTPVTGKSSFRNAPPTALWGWCAPASAVDHWY